MATLTLAPNSTWFSQGGTTVKRASITQINIVNSYTPTGSETASWDASADKDNSVKAYVTGTVLTLAGNGSGKIYANSDSSYVFSNSGSDKFTSLTTINGLNLLDTKNATTINRMFAQCKKLASADVSTWNTASCTNMYGVFQVCLELTELDLSRWNVSNVTTMYGMFMSIESMGFMKLKSIGAVGNWNVGKVTNMGSMFQLCKSLETLDTHNWSPVSCTNMNSMFYGCVSLTEIDASNWNVGNVNDMKAMFGSVERFGDMAITSIGDVGNWNVSKVTTMDGMFQRCSNLVSLNTTGWNPVSCTNMNSMFYGCSSLTTIGDTAGWNTSKVTTTIAMFRECVSLTELDVSNWDVSKVTAMRNMFSCGENYGVTPMVVQELDVSNWDTSSCTDMSFMFYGCKGPKTIDVSNWDVANVTTFDHMTAHSYLTLNGVDNWAMGAACTNANAMFHSIQNTSIDVSKYNTSNVTVFDQMFQSATKLTKITGLENFDTSSGLGFSEMFQYCSNIKELNLSSFDTTHAKDGAEASANGSYTTTMSLMFQDTNRLEKITLGKQFAFHGDGTTTNAANHAVLPTPSATYITGADGNWYDIDKTPYVAANVPSNTLETYYASTDVVDAEENELVFVKQGSLIRAARAIRTKNGLPEQYQPAEFADAILAIGS